jgi:RimJ/RimL family protein N-acetyltransferase
MSKVALEPLAAHHLAALRCWINDPRIAEPFLFARQIDEEGHRRWFERIAADSTQRLFAVTAGDSHVGALGLKGIDQGQCQAQIWIYLAPQVHGSGIGSKAVALATEFAFERLRLDRLTLIVRADNVAARRIYAKAGFTVAGPAEPIEGFREIAVEAMALDEPAWRRRAGRGGKVAMMQPAFLPWLGFFELMAIVDTFIVLDDFQFTRHSWAHHNRLLLAGKPSLVSLPVRHPGTLGVSFLDVAEADPERWRRKFARSLDQNYRRAAQFAAVRPLVDDWLAAKHANLAELEIDWIKRLSGYLGIRCEIRRSSELATGHLRRSERILALAEAVGGAIYYAANGAFGYMAEDGVFPGCGVDVLFQDHAPVPYSQAGTDTFVSHLSALDAAFSLDVRELRRVVRGTALWLTWDERAAPVA